MIVTLLLAGTAMAARLPGLPARRGMPMPPGPPEIPPETPLIAVAEFGGMSCEDEPEVNLIPAGVCLPLDEGLWVMAELSEGAFEYSVFGSPECEGEPLEVVMGECDVCQQESEERRRILSRKGMEEDDDDDDDDDDDNGSFIVNCDFYPLLAGHPMAFVASYEDDECQVPEEDEDEEDEGEGEERKRGQGPMPPKGEPFPLGVCVETGDGEWSVGMLEGDVVTLSVFSDEECSAAVGSVSGFCDECIASGETSFSVACETTTLGQVILMGMMDDEDEDDRPVVYMLGTQFETPDCTGDGETSPVPLGICLDGTLVDIDEEAEMAMFKFFENEECEGESEAVQVPCNSCIPDGDGASNVYDCIRREGNEPSALPDGTEFLEVSIFDGSATCDEEAAEVDTLVLPIGVCFAVSEFLSAMYMLDEGMYSYALFIGDNCEGEPIDAVEGPCGVCQADEEDEDMRRMLMRRGMEEEEEESESFSVSCEPFPYTSEHPLLFVYGYEDAECQVPAGDDDDDDDDDVKEREGDEEGDPYIMGLCVENDELEVYQIGMLDEEGTVTLTLYRDDECTQMLDIVSGTCDECIQLGDTSFVVGCDTATLGQLIAESVFEDDDDDDDDDEDDDDDDDDDADVGLRLALRGSCANQVGVEVIADGLSPGGNFAILYGSYTEGMAIPNAQPCAGTWINIQNPNFLRASADNIGEYYNEFGPFNGAGVCGLYVQLLDLNTCNVSSPARIEE